MPFDNLPTKQTDAAAIISRAIDLLETNGWCQMEQVDSEGRLCLVGALGGLGNVPPAVSDIVRKSLPWTWQLLNSAGTPHADLMAFNDNQYSVRPVLRALRRAHRRAQQMRC